MRKHLLLVLCAALALTVGAATATGGGSKSAAGQVRVKGSGVRAASSPGSPTFTFSFDAKTQAGPGGIYGTLTGDFPGLASFSGVVTCLNISGNNATVGGVVTSGSGRDDSLDPPDHDLTGDWFITIIQDNGKAHGGASPDKMGFVDWGDRGYFVAGGSSGTPFPTFTSLCANPIADLGSDLFSLNSGDIKIGT